MMRSSNSKTQGTVEVINSEAPVENGLPTKEDDEETVRELAAQVVDDVVKRASEAARQRTAKSLSPAMRNRGCSLPRLPTIQIDTVSSPPPSPVDWTPPEEAGEYSIDETEIQLELDTAEQESETPEELKEYLKAYVEDLLSQAMVVAEKKLQFSGLPEEDEECCEEPSEPEPVQCPSETEKEMDNSEIRSTAEKVVEEVISKATETVAERLENGIDAFPISFDDAPEEVKEAAAAFVKEIVGKAVAMAEEKSVPAVPFNFEDVETIKNTGPWYVRAREAFIRLLRTACFCTPRRTDS